MSNDLIRVFNNNEFGQVRTIENNGKIMFVASDVAKMLGYSNVRDAISRHCKGVEKHDTPTNGGIQTINIITEGDVFRLITHSKLPAAQRFESWIFDEVLPAIRQTGGYGNALPPITPELMYALGDHIKQLKLENATLILQNSKAKEAKEKIRFTPNKDGNYTVTSIAQVYGMTAQELNIILRDKGIQYKDPSNGKWRLCTLYRNKGYESIHSYYQHTEGTMSWTPKGLEFLKERMACWGYSYKQN